MKISDDHQKHIDGYMAMLIAPGKALVAQIEKKWFELHKGHIELHTELEKQKNVR